MTVIDYLDYTATLHGVQEGERTARVAEAIRRTELGAKAIDPISTLCRGHRQRVGVAQALLHRPRVLILDEPTTIERAGENLGTLFCRDRGAGPPPTERFVPRRRFGTKAWPYRVMLSPAGVGQRCCSSPIGQRGRAVNASGSRWPASSRRQPAKAIMAPLSVQNSGLG